MKLFLIGLFFFGACFANLPSTEKGQKPKKFFLSVCSVFKNEAKYLKEWIEYHRLIGVNHFYLYNIQGSDNYLRILNPYIKEGLVSLIHWPDLSGDEENRVSFWMLGSQIPAYENAAQFRAVNETEWLTFLDVDEFLVPTFSDNLIEVLKQYNEYPAVVLNSDFFDTSNRSKENLIIESIRLIKSPSQILEKKVVKTIFKPKETIGFLWPPFQYIFKNNKKALELNKTGLRINHYLNRNDNHFTNKSLVKVSSENEKNRLLDMGFDIEDSEKAIHRFIPKMHIKLGNH